MPTRNNFSAILNRLNGSVWYITQDSLDLMMDILDRHIKGEVDRGNIDLRFGAGDGRNGDSDSVNMRGIGILPIHGPIFPKANMMTRMSGATSIEEFQQNFRAMMANDHVSTILLDIDSPGGNADMIPEMAAEIREARERKPIVAVANTMCCSAAQYLAAQANKVYATPSGQVGSVGVIMIHTDKSRKDQMEGIDRTYIHAGSKKADLYKTLTPESKAEIQEKVDYHYEMFVNDMAAGRNVSTEHVLEHFGQGSILMPNEAVEAGMIDGVQTFDQVLGRLIETGGDIETIDSGISAHGRGLTLHSSYDADKAHSEPGTGTGGEPTPRETPEKDDPAIKGGWRRDPPPVAYEPEESVMGREWLETLASSLGIEFSAETPDEELTGLVDTRVSEVITPLRAAASDAEAHRQWERDYPEQAAQLARLENRDRAFGASEFAKSYERFGGDLQHGFSPVVREEIERAHLAVSERTFSHENLKQLCDSLATKTSVVAYGEGGSARQGETPDAGDGNARQRFAEVVRTAMTEHGMSQNQAIEAMSKQYPELAEAYMSGQVGR